MKNILFLIFLVLFLVSCGGGGGNSTQNSNNDTTSENSPNNDTNSNQSSRTISVYDSLLEGLSYKYEDNTSGTTNAKGQFSYKEGKKVSFYLKDWKIGEISTINKDNKIFLPEILGLDRKEITNSKVIKIARILQSIDDDSSDNKITLDSIKVGQISDKLKNKTIDDVNLTRDLRDTDVFDILKTTEDVKNHLLSTYNSNIKQSCEPKMDLNTSDEFVHEAYKNNAKVVCMSEQELSGLTSGDEFDKILESKIQYDGWKDKEYWKKHYLKELVFDPRAICQSGDENSTECNSDADTKKIQDFDFSGDRRLNDENAKIYYYEPVNGYVRQDNGTYKLQSRFKQLNLNDTTSDTENFKVERIEKFKLKVTATKEFTEGNNKINGEHIRNNTGATIYFYSYGKWYFITLKGLLEVEINSQKKKDEVNKYIDKVIADNSLKNKSDYKKIEFVHNHIIKRTKYGRINGKFLDSQSAYGCLINQVCVCEGYARAFKGFMDKLDSDFNAGIQIGYGYSELHAWNTVKLEGKTYYMDLTWDDDGSLRYKQYGSKGVLHRYFLRTAKYMKNHGHSLNTSSIDENATDYSVPNPDEMVLRNK